jgi:hypothetical protein
MRLLRTCLIATLLAAGPTALLAVTATPASAHVHPTPTELVSPAVVRVETYAEVSISLIEHNRKGRHIGLIQKTFRPMLAAGSGFAVDPSGGVVTTPEIIDIDLRRAEIYAVNQLFRQRYGAAAPLPADPYTTHTIKDRDPADEVAGRLQRCYQPNTTDSTGGCLVFSKRAVEVLPFVSSQERYGNLTATVLEPKEGQKSDVVVLKVGASSMPTARIAPTVQGAPFAVLGFKGVPTNGPSLIVQNGHFARSGATELARDAEYPRLVTDMAAGTLGGPVVGESGEAVGFLVRRRTGADTQLTLVGPDTIRKALADAKIKAQSGPTDSSYNSAMHNYKNKLYAASIPDLTQTLKLYPGHALANEALAEANRRQGTAEDLTDAVAPGAPAKPSQPLDFRRTVLPLAVGVLALVLLAVAIFVLLRRRRRLAAASPEPPEEGPAPVVLPTPRQSSSAQPGPATMRRQETVLRSRMAVGSPSTRQPADPRSEPETAPNPATAATCRRCGSEVAPSQGFCAQCGQRLT